MKNSAFSLYEVNMFYVYVIKSSEGLHYTGMTEDLEKRLNEHNEKKLSFRTKQRMEWEIEYKKVMLFMKTKNIFF